MVWTLACVGARVSRPDRDRTSRSHAESYSTDHTMEHLDVARLESEWLRPETLEGLKQEWKFGIDTSSIVRWSGSAPPGLP